MGEFAGSDFDALTGTSHHNPAPLGKAMKTRIERGEAYASPEVYNVEITVLEVLRGVAADISLRSQNLSGSFLKPGNEVLLAHLKVSYSRRNRSPGGESFLFTEGQFCTYSPEEDLEENSPSIPAPHPYLNGSRILPGETREGWLILQVTRKESRPLLVFKRQNIDAVHSVWGSLWFKLYA